MANEKNMLIYLPFDEGRDSKTAFDYSPNRADGTVTDAELVAGKVGNAVKFDGIGTVEVKKEIISPEVIGDEWTILAWIRSLEMESGTPSMLIWTIALEGVDNYIEKKIPIQPSSWMHVAITKRGNLFKFYLNTVLIDTATSNDAVAGISLAQDYYGSEDGKGCVDDMKIYNVALSYEEITNEMSNVKVLEYYIDGVNLKEYGVYVSGSAGLLDRPKLKKPYSESWPDYHGVMIDLNHKYFEERTITLSCFIKSANGKGEFASAVNRFLQIFDKTGTHRLIVDIHPTKPLVYEVYLEDSVDIKKTWSDGVMVGTFTLKLKEPNPVKKVLKFMKTGTGSKPVTINITTNKSVDIFWGDGKHDFDVSGDSIQLAHEYEDPGEYYIIVAGCIDEIITFETNSIIVWPKI